MWLRSVSVCKAGLRQNGGSGQAKSGSAFSPTSGHVLPSVYPPSAALSPDGSLRGARRIRSGRGNGSHMCYSSANEQIDAGDNVAAALIAAASKPSPTAASSHSPSPSPSTSTSTSTSTSPSPAASLASLLCVCAQRCLQRLGAGTLPENCHQSLEYITHRLID